jgi:hypothetical protein
MSKRIRVIVGVAAAFVLGFALVAIPLAVSAHPTGNERRTVAACRLIPDRNDRQECIVCVSRPRPHHYHPRGAAPGYCHINGADLR